MGDEWTGENLVREGKPMKKSSAVKMAKPAKVSTKGNGTETRVLAKVGKAITAAAKSAAKSVKTAPSKILQKAPAPQPKPARAAPAPARSLKVVPAPASLVADVAAPAAPRPSRPAGGSMLNAKQIRELEAKLMRLREEINAALSGKAHVFNVESHNESLIKGDDAEVAEKQRQSNAALQEIDMLKNRILMIGRALRKIDEGCYGFCEETEEPIGYERLLVIPWARYGVKVQELRERRLRDFKSNRLRAEL
jgi:DnaK suppressor protein